MALARCAATLTARVQGRSFKGVSVLPREVVSPGLDPETLQFTLESISEFAQRELSDQLLIELDERDEVPEALIRRMCSEELGVQLVFVAEEHGGMGGSAVDVYRVCECMAAIDLGIATSVLATSLGSDPIRIG